MSVMTVGRVFRNVAGEWLAIGRPLPAWDHVPPRPNDPVAVWVLPAGADEVAYRAGDVLTYGETVHQLMVPVPRRDVAWGDVLHAASLEKPAEVYRGITAPMDNHALRRRELAVVHELLEEVKPFMVVGGDRAADVPRLLNRYFFPSKQLLAD